MISSRQIEPRHARVLARDLVIGLRRQMFLWGRDVMSRNGNLLIAQGFEKRPGPSWRGTSRYVLLWEGGSIHLQGDVAGWEAPAGGDGFLFCRRRGRVSAWRGSLPGSAMHDWPAESPRGGDAEALEAGRPFLRWWIVSDDWVVATQPLAHRRSAEAAHRALPITPPVWLDAACTRPWLVSLEANPAACRPSAEVRLLGKFLEEGSCAPAPTSLPCRAC